MLQSNHNFLFCFVVYPRLCHYLTHMRCYLRRIVLSSSSVPLSSIHLCIVYIFRFISTKWLSVGRLPKTFLSFHERHKHTDLEEDGTYDCRKIHMFGTVVSLTPFESLFLSYIHFHFGRRCRHYCYALLFMLLFLLAVSLSLHFFHDIPFSTFSTSYFISSPTNNNILVSVIHIALYYFSFEWHRTLSLFFAQ